MYLFIYVIFPEIQFLCNCSVVQLVATVENVIKCVEMIIARIDEVRATFLIQVQKHVSFYVTLIIE